MEAAEAGDEVVEAIVEGHPRPIVARPMSRPRARRVRYGPEPDPPATVVAVMGFWWTMDTDSALIDALAPTSTGRSSRSCWRTRTGSIRSLCGSWVTRATRRRPRRTRSSGHTGRSAGTTGPDPRPPTPTVAGDDRPQPVSLAADPSSARGAVDAVARPGPPGRARAAHRDADGPAAASAARAAAEWADLLLTLPPAYRSAVVLRHVDGLSYPELAIALDRPEGTVKAQVHRGLALLRTAFEAAQRHEREEMTA